MNRSLTLLPFGVITLTKGAPGQFARHLLPHATVFSAGGPWGDVCVQEIQTPKYFVRHFLLFLREAVSFLLEAEANTLQSLLSLQGECEHHVDGEGPVLLKNREYLLFNAGERQAVTALKSAGFYSLLNTHYVAEGYQDYLALFPSLENDLQQTAQSSSSFLYPPKPARFTALDAIAAIWLDQYGPALQDKHIELRLESTLFSLLAQTYTPAPESLISPLERETAQAARELILKDIRLHYTLQEIALALNCSTSYLRRAFQKVYKTGVFQLLREHRMEMAKAMLLQGESLKAVAIEVGMKPSNFPKEFKAYFGYTVTALKMGQR